MSIKIPYLQKLLHEVNTPLSNIILLSEMMKNKVPVSNNLKEENANHIFESAQKIRKIIDLLNSVSDSFNNNIKLEISKIDIISLIKEEINYQRKANINNKTVKIYFESEINTCLAEVDKFWFKQLIANLVQNSVNHTKEGIIEVITSIFSKNDQDYFQLIIRDTGIGIPENEKESIFKPFVRGSRTEAERIVGSGVGLSVVKEIIEAHGGKVVAKSNNDKGATFELNFPLLNNIEF